MYFSLFYNLHTHFIFYIFNYREIRHPNVLLLMGTTQTEEHGLVAIFEPVDCTLFNYIHEQGERISVQGVAKCAGNLAAALKHAHMRGYIHSAISPHCIFLASNGIAKLGGWELATNLNGVSRQMNSFLTRAKSIGFHPVVL